MAYTFTPEQKDKLERIALAMLVGVDILCEAGVPDNNPASADLAEGHVAIMALLYPNGIPVAPGEQPCCPCGQPADHGIIQ